MNSIPLNSPAVPDLSQINTAPPSVSVMIQWEDRSTTKFEVEDIQKFPEDDYRLFMMCMLAGNVRDPRFVEVFKPTAAADEEQVAADAPEQSVDDSDAVAVED